MEALEELVTGWAVGFGALWTSLQPEGSCRLHDQLHLPTVARSGCKVEPSSLLLTSSVHQFQLPQKRVASPLSFTHLSSPHPPLLPHGTVTPFRILHKRW